MSTQAKERKDSARHPSRVDQAVGINGDSTVAEATKRLAFLEGMKDKGRMKPRNQEKIATLKAIIQRRTSKGETK